MAKIPLEQLLGAPQQQGMQQAMQQPMQQDMQQPMIKSGRVPLEQLLGAPQQPQQSGILNTLVDNPLVRSINTLGGQFAQGVSQGAAELANLPIDALRGIGNKLGINTGDFRFQGVKAPFVNEADIVGKGVNELSQFLLPGGIATKAVKGIEGFKGANALKNILGGSLGGFLGSEDRGMGAAVGATGGAVATGAIGAGNVLKNLFGKKLDQRATELFNIIGKGKDKVNLNAENNSAIIANYKNKKLIGSKLYEKALKRAEKNGYTPTVRETYEPISGTTSIEGGKYIIKPRKETKAMMEDLLSPEEDKGFSDLIYKGRKAYKSYNADPSLTNTNRLHTQLLEETKAMMENVLSSQKNKGFSDLISKSKEAYKLYNANPSLRNAHKLQSQLGEDAADLMAGEASTEEKMLAQQIGNLRKRFNEDIPLSLKENGHKNLSEALRKAADYWKTNVVPYHEAPEIARLVRKKKHIPNILNTLKNTDEKGNYDIIRAHLMENPDARKSLLAQQLSQKVNPGTKQIKFKDAMEQINKAPDVVSELFHDEPINYLNKLHSNKKKLQKAVYYGSPIVSGGFSLEEALRNYLKGGE